jgi:hypothetical protein
MIKGILAAGRHWQRRPCRSQQRQSLPQVLAQELPKALAQPSAQMVSHVGNGKRNLRKQHTNVRLVGSFWGGWGWKGTNSATASYLQPPTYPLFGNDGTLPLPLLTEVALSPRLTGATALFPSWLSATIKGVGAGEGALMAGRRWQRQQAKASSRQADVGKNKNLSKENKNIRLVRR